MDERHDSADSAHGISVIRGADRLTDAAADSLTVCPACGYPKFGPGLCAYCEPGANASWVS